MEENLRMCGYIVSVLFTDNVTGVGYPAGGLHSHHTSNVMNGS